MAIRQKLGTYFFTTLGFSKQYGIENVVKPKLRDDNWQSRKLNNQNRFFKMGATLSSLL